MFAFVAGLLFGFGLGVWQSERFWALVEAAKDRFLR